MKSWLLIQLVGLKLLGLGLVIFTSWQVAGWIIFFSGGCCVMAHHFLPRSQGLCDVVTGFKPKGREVWLTIDDGPDPEDTPRILDLLDEHRARATFFMIGKKVRQHPELAREVINRGHTIGNHTYHHPLKDFWCMGPKRVGSEIGLTQDQFRQAAVEARFFRPPVGIKNVFLKTCLARCGLRYVAWSIRSGDSLASDKNKVVSKVLREARPGAIILMHEGNAVARAVRVEAIREILQGLAEDGYTCVLPEDGSLVC